MELSLKQQQKKEQIYQKSIKNPHQNTFPDFPKIDTEAVLLSNVVKVAAWNGLSFKHFRWGFLSSHIS